MNYAVLLQILLNYAVLLRGKILFYFLIEVTHFCRTDTLKFEEIVIDMPYTKDGEETFFSAFVDLDNDKDLDIVATSSGGSIYFLENQNNHFLPPRKILQKDRYLALNLAFADLDHNSLLDIFVGNWGLNGYKNKNDLYFNHFPLFEEKELVGNVAGTTLAVMASDLDNNGWADLIEGNDFEQKDFIRLNQGQGKFKILQPDKFKFSRNTMSYDSGDVNNDLRLDLFSTDMLFRQKPYHKDCTYFPDFHQESCSEIFKKEQILKTTNINSCQLLSDKKERYHCAIALMILQSAHNANSLFCNPLKNNNSYFYELCLNFNLQLVQASGEDQIFSNVLLIQDAQHNFSNQENNFGVAATNWSWSGKFFDADGDGYLDLYIGTGYSGLYSQEVQMYPNYFFENNHGVNFKEKGSSYNLDDPITTTAFSFADLNNDGHLDIIANGVGGPYRIFMNQIKSNTITFSIRDTKGNWFGIGSKIIITSAAGKKQLRELLLGRGYLSTDQPILHFGLGEEKYISDIEITSSLGEKYTIHARLEANKHYTIKLK